MDDIPVEGLRIQLQNDYTPSVDKFVAHDIDCQFEDKHDTELSIEDDLLVDNMQIVTQVVPVRHSDEEEGEISMQDESMDVDADNSTSVTDSTHRIVRSDSPSSDVEDTEKSSYTNHYFEGRKTRRYHNPYLNIDKNPEKLSSRANRFANDDNFTNVEFDREKLGSRAERFGIPQPKPITFEEIPSLDLPSDEKLLDLYIAVGLIPDVGGKLSLEQVDPKSRLDSILIRGTNNMSTNEIFEYLSDNRVHPLEMEWVNDACCVVIFKDSYETAATLLTITKPILIEPPRKSKLQQNSNDETGAEEDGEISDEEDDINYHDTDVVSSRLIKVPMPPGYVWRFAVPCEKATGILMRFANVNDKKQEKSERHSVYYKKHGNPNYGGVPAFFTASAKTSKSRKVSENSNEPEKVLPKVPIENKYAWSDLSAAWGEQEREEEMSKKWPKSSPKKLHTSRGGPLRTNSAIKSLKIQVNFDEASNSVKSRLKRKRDHSSDEELESPIPVSNRRHHHRRSKAGSDDDSGDTIDWTKKLRGPLMRMHADEEEQRMKRRSKFRKLSSSSFHSSSGSNEWRAARTMEIDRRPKRSSVKNRLGGFRDHEMPISASSGDEVEFNAYELRANRNPRLKKSLAERLGRRNNSPENEDDIFV